MYSHPLKEFFDGIYGINDGRWFASYFPGHSMVLAFGLILKNIRLILSVLAIGIVIITYFIDKMPPLN